MISFNKIGKIKSPYKIKEGTPIQPNAANDMKGELHLNKELIEGLKDLDGFSHLVIIFHLHLSTGYKLTVKPYLDNTLRGVFSTRAPHRPNQIGMSTVKIDKIASNVIYFTGVDMLDGTPVIDIKPYIPYITPQENVRCGWLEDRLERFDNTKADTRF